MCFLSIFLWTSIIFIHLLIVLPLNYAFVDVVVNDDNLLFIDPILLETARDRWCQGANAIVQSFFNAFYEAYRTKNQVKKEELLSHAGEQNGTRLGYGRGDNGKGNQNR